MKDSELKAPISTQRKPAFPAQQASVLEDDFGDFTGQEKDVFEDVDFGDFETAKPTIPRGKSGPNTQQWGTSTEQNLLDFEDLPLPSRLTGSSGSHGRTTGFFALPPTMSLPSTSFSSHSPGPYYFAYKTHHLSLLPFCKHLRSSPSPSSTLSLLFPPSPATALPPSLSHQSSVLLSLIHFLSPQLQPLRDWGFLRQALLAAADRFDSTCLVAFEVSDGKKDEEGMKEAAGSSWKVWEAGGGEREKWECGRVWVEKREVFYDTARWDSLENIM